MISQQNSPNFSSELYDIPSVPPEKRSPFEKMIERVATKDPYAIDPALHEEYIQASMDFQRQNTELLAENAVLRREIDRLRRALERRR